VDNATAYWKMMLTPMLENNFPWAFAFGNHDDLASGTGGTRKDLMTVNKSPQNIVFIFPSMIAHLR
jgi:hypothetical protein